MGFLTFLGISIIAEQVGSKVQSMVEDSHRTDYNKTLLDAEAKTRIAEMQETTKRENAVLRAEIARMHEETERANARIRAEARVQAEKIRAAGQVATATILASGNGVSNDRINSFITYETALPGNAGELSRNCEIPDLIPASFSETNFCPFCGRDVAAGSFFCRTCGKRIR